ncbi:MAG: L-serine ammonia-lyase, iron-sulfur-dependent, subunit alpha [Bacillota bacterium]|jgi:L-serine dehydratase|nr:L-serine ammonia-lyase, iron-sulfur-dependent, subunit alpha [Bacillota bacterium]NLD12564.1 L-serine ammonia-lyase, iron-sulfur-dependent, subunit alpha [Bacillota bacterium]HCD41650.1 L-serine ammonia-lyase, iron-sulfur-dependent, subunit alpha [Bacillota bacterium]HOB88543.1 L-serine ammonia-lyase, iron-sulfur-dependent, subunit alpha [Bacillota bacterium]HOJ57217.1 L-serine ammonia-lyase, iron-sulfur-dependent, subunit alpha [Bacillota bacterium]
MAIVTMAKLVEEASSRGMTIGALAREVEARESGLSVDELNEKMRKRLEVMRQSVAAGLQGVRSRSGLTGEDAVKMTKAQSKGLLISNEPLNTAMAYALAVAEVNAAMGLIVAAPTGGSCGILPGVLLSVGKRLGSDDDALLEALFAAGAVGAVVARSSTLAGAAAGCQAECGTGAAMAAAAATQLAHGSPHQCANAVAFAFKGLLGLVCDPVAGLVEVPCIKRNAISVSVALAAADMALAGIESVIPADEVIETMGIVGRDMPASLRETALGGLAVTPTGKRLARELASAPPSDEAAGHK